MFIRLVRTTGPEGADSSQTLKIWQEEIEARLREQPGYLGAIVMRAETGPEAATATYWQDREAIQRADAAMNGGPAVGRTNERTGRKVTEVDVFETAFAARAKPPAADTFLRSNDLVSPKDRIDASIANVRDRVYPIVSGQPGFRSLLCAVNRETGRSIVSTSWDTQDDLNRSEAAVTDARQQAAQIAGADGIKVEKWRVVYANVALPAGVQS